MALTPSEKVKRWRARQRAGLIVVPVEVDPVALAVLLAHTGFLPPGDDDRPALAAALERALDVWGAGVTTTATARL